MRKKDKSPISIRDPDEGVRGAAQQTPIIEVVPVEDPPEIVLPPEPLPEPQHALIRPQHHILRPTLRRRDGAADPDRDIALDIIESEVIMLKMFSFILKALRMVTYATLSIVIVFFVGSCLNRNNSGLFAAILAYVTRPSQQNYEKLTGLVFPRTEADNSYQLTIKVAESNFAAAAVVFEVTYPLLLANPLTTLLMACSMFIIYQLVSFLHSFLQNITGVMHARLLGRAEAQEPAHQPQIA